jgi:hypothetical protein
MPAYVDLRSKGLFLIWDYLGSGGLYLIWDYLGSGGLYLICDYLGSGRSCTPVEMMINRCW